MDRSSFTLEAAFLFPAKSGKSLIAVRACASCGEIIYNAIQILASLLLEETGDVRLLCLSVSIFKNRFIA